MESFSRLYRADPPRADDHPNDIYSYIPVRRREISKDELIIYPQFYGFDQGKDSEQKVYEIQSIKDLIMSKAKSKNKKVSDGYETR